MISRFIKSNPVFVIAGAAALVSMFFVPPNAGYASYIDWRTVGLLLCQLMIVQGLMESGAFRLLSDRIVRTAKSTRSLSAVLIFACFFVSMLVTNDVALISFVPLTIVLLSAAGAEDLLIPVVVLETIAANLGSMLMPFGNPQNLYLYNLSGISGLHFIGIMLPYTLVSLCMLLIACLFLSKRKLELRETTENRASGRRRKIEGAGSLVLLADRNVLRKVNYVLPLTFIVFFILTGNIQALPGFSEALSAVIRGHEMITAVAISQVISNVPAAMLLSSFTDDYEALIVGTDIGGLGTLIASMASLISFQFYCGASGAKPGKYLAVFTLLNAAGLAVLLGTALLF